MKINCSIGFHKWNGCKCFDCGRIRDVKHNWEKDCEKCSVCGQIRSKIHKWKDESCIICGTKMDYRAEILFKEFQGFLTDVPLNPQVCKVVFHEALITGASLESAADIFSNEFKKDPKRFIDEDQVIWKAVEMILIDLKSAFKEVTILDAPCKKKLFSDMKSGMSLQDAVESLINEMKSKPTEYIILPTYYYPPREYRREGTDKGAIGHDRLNVRTLTTKEWLWRTAFMTNETTAITHTP